MPFPSDTLLFSLFYNLLPLLFKLLPFHWLDGLLHSNATLLSTSTLFLTHVHPASFSAFHFIHSFIHSFIHVHHTLSSLIQIVHTLHHVRLEMLQFSFLRQTELFSSFFLRSGLLLCCFHQLLEHSVKFTPLK